MPWRMQIKTPSTKNKWVDIRPTPGIKETKPYEYGSKPEAERMLDICYGEIVRGFHENHFARVVYVD